MSLSLGSKRKHLEDLGSTADFLPLLLLSLLVQHRCDEVTSDQLAVTLPQVIWHSDHLHHLIDASPRTFHPKCQLDVLHPLCSLALVLLLLESFEIFEVSTPTIAKLGHSVVPRRSKSDGLVVEFRAYVQEVDILGKCVG